MNKFIEVTSIDDGMKLLIPIEKITCIVYDGDDGVFVELSTDMYNNSSGVYITDSYDGIKRKLGLCEV